MQASTEAEIAVIVVNYGTAALAAEAVESVLARDHGGRTVEVHLLDNASPGDDAKTLAALAAARGWGPRVTLHFEAVNHGFGRGNNLVLTRLATRPTPPDKVFLLNPDARLENEALAVLAAFLDSHPQAAAAGARISRPVRHAGDTGASTEPATSAFRFPSAISEFSDGMSFGPVARLCAGSQVPLAPILPTMPVDWVSGAAVMFRRTALESVGGFDPAFFLYFEEVDLMRRLRENGWEIWHVAEAGVTHEEGAATGVGSAMARRKRPDYWYDSWRHYFVVSRGRGGAALCAVARLTGWTLNLLLSALRRRQPPPPPGFAGAMWRRVFRPLMGLAPTPPT